VTARVRGTAIAVWSLSERAVTELAYYDGLSRWAIVRRWFSRRRMLDMVDEGEGLGRGEALRNLFGARVGDRDC